MYFLGYILPVTIAFLIGGILGSFTRGDMKKTTLTILGTFFVPEVFLLLFSKNSTHQLGYGIFCLALLFGFIVGYWKYGKFRSGAAILSLR